MARWTYSAVVVRREWGSGSLYRTGDRWRVAVSLGRDPFGKRIRREWQCRSEEAARAKLREVTGRLDRGLRPEDSRVTLAAYAPTWLRSVQGTVRPSTLAFYRTLVEVHLDEIGHHRVSRIGPPLVRALIERRQEEGYSSRTIRGVLDVLRMVLRQAMADGIVDRNAVELVRRPRLEQKEPVHFTAAEARRFLEVAKDDPLYSLYAVGLGTGLRRGELLALVQRDIDWTGRTLAVRKSKTAAGVRAVPLPAFAFDALAALPKAPGPIWPYSPSHATRHVAVICERAGLPRLTFHGLRHSAASILLAEGVPPLVIQQILGHSKAAMTAHYARSEEAQQREAMERLGRAVG